MKTHKNAICSIILLLSFLGLCQDGTLDTSFGGNGFVVTDFYGDSDKSYSIIQQSDGKIVSFGFANYGDIALLSRYLPNGDLDPSFGTNGMVVNDFGNDPEFVFYTSLHQQNDGKIVSSSEYRDPNEDLDIFLVRYLENGVIDPTFGNNGTVRIHYGEDKLASTLLLPDGQIVVGGTTTVGSSRYILLAKYLENGTLDPSFGDNGMVLNYINDQPAWCFPLVLQPDGKILIAYRKKEANNLQTLMFQRYLGNGQLDSSFGVGGMVTTNIAAGRLFGSIALKENGNILAAIRLEGPILAQFLPNGDPDLSFGIDGKKDIVVFSVVPFNIMLDEAENILISGNNFGFEISDYYLTRFDPDGILDPAFGNNGMTVLGFESNGIIMQTDNKILVTGCTFWYNGGDVDFVVTRLNNGTLGVEEFNTEGFKFYPNPSNGLFTLKHSNSFSSEIAYQITDVTGKIIQAGSLKDNESVIDISEAQSGMYFLRAANTTLRLIKN